MGVESQLTHGLHLVKIMSTSVVVRFLSNNFMSLQSLENFVPSIRGAASLAPKLQNSLKTSTNEADDLAAAISYMKLIINGAWPHLLRMGYF